VETPPSLSAARGPVGVALIFPHPPFHDECAAFTSIVTLSAPGPPFFGAVSVPTPQDSLIGCLTASALVVASIGNALENDHELNRSSVRASVLSLFNVNNFWGAWALVCLAELLQSFV